MHDVLWWQSGIIYQIYPRSFKDGNGDGIGDLPGIIEKLDYLEGLGIAAIWLSPIFPSPMKDFGYDVSDYTGIHPMFGTMADFDRLLAEAHQRGLKVLLDLVPNHTSDEHPWFLESRSSRDNPKRDWYVWRDPAADGGPPNNWLSVFGGSAWEYDAQTGQYYLHSFVKEQPDLNYRNPEVLQAILDVMQFWLKKGVDGFRVDVITRLAKDREFRDEPLDPNWDQVDPYNSLIHIYTKNMLETHPIIIEMRKVIDQYPDHMMVGETYMPNQELVAYYGQNLDECHLPFNFQLITTPWNAEDVRRAVDAYEAALPEGAWPNWVLGNHDRPRVASRVGAAQARVANMLLLTLRGTPTSYYGEEIGMHNVQIPPEFIQDPPAINQPEIADIVGRDPERTPMQWDGSANAGFTHPGVAPWLPLAEDYPQRNVALEAQDPRSMLNLYRRLATLHQAEPALHRGGYRSIEVGEPDLYVYERFEKGAHRYLVVLNFGTGEHTLDLTQSGQQAEIAVSTAMERAGAVNLADLRVRPNEGLLIRIG